MIDWSSHFFPPLVNKDVNISKVAWLVRLRWMVIALQILTVLVLGIKGEIKAEFFPYFIGVINLAIVFSFISIVNIKSKNRVEERFLVFQTLFDLVQMFFFLYLVSFEKNPLIEILYLNLVVAVFSLSFFWNLFHLVLIVLALGFFYLNPNADIHNHHHFYSHLFTMFLLWSVLNWLMTVLHSFQNTFSKVQDYKNRMDRLKSIGAMSSGICHELATPMNTVKLKLNRTLRKREFNLEDITIALLELEKCEGAIKRLANSTRQFDRPVEELVYLENVTLEVIASYEPEAFALKAQTSAPVKVNVAVLHQTLLDLMDNARDVSPHEMVAINIYEKDDKIVWEIVSRGDVFPAIVLDKLGEPFLTNKPHGVGLGLFNAYNFMLASNGHLIIKNISDDEAMVQLIFSKV